ncbi:hypothetical protein PAPYR_546 [Paratrimastix pyriformis]|uniref:C2H2-type domain-containing protein n=1 Tax=Paratrimastix pyriformis TaxID=342808 RepID=A0ABQ8UTW0_9EUKA|nr:hypothetical protein PAPYR_546 [Paratrimastix pyriformis]
MDKAFSKIGITRRTCQACGVRFREGCSLEEKLAHCHEPLHLQRFVRARHLFNGEIIPCDIDRRFQHLCVLCCCGVETGKTDEHLASAGHAAQRALACQLPVTATPAPAQPHLVA